LINSQGSSRHSQDQRLSATGPIFGTPFYMSPEQCMGLDVDSRADIYSLGCALFETIKGRPPFRGGSALDIVSMHLDEAVPTCADACPDNRTGQSMEVLIGRMMAKKVQDRYPSMAEVRRDLERIKDKKDVGRPTAVTFASRPTQDGLVPGRSNQPPKEGGLGGLAISMIVIFGFAILGLLGWGAHQILQPAKPSAQANASPGDTASKLASGQQFPETVHGASIGDSAVVTNNFLQDPRVAEAGKVFSKVRKINASESGGKKTIHFPSYSIGNIILEDGPHAAKGDVPAPADGIVRLEIDWKKDPATLGNLSIFSKIDHDLISTLSVKSAGQYQQNISKIATDTEASRLTKVLEIATKWARLEKITLHGFSFIREDDKILQQLDHMPQLQRLNARGDQLSMKKLSGHKFLSKLHELDVERSKNIGALLTGLSGSKALTNLNLEHTAPTTAGLAKLGKCPNLDHLGLEACELNRDQMKAISQFPSLNTVYLSGSASLEDDLGILSQSKTIRFVEVHGDNSSPSEKERLHKAYPIVVFARSSETEGGSKFGKFFQEKRRDERLQ
jgi:hypothetical protein